ncbi:hypothetical protein ACFC18_26205 [Streptomyces sp. NPDC056121]|nr:hypothetical protein [Streptomyces longhuiensis]
MGKRIHRGNWITGNWITCLLARPIITRAFGNILDAANTAPAIRD